MNNQQGPFRHAMKFALSGIRYGFLHERNMRIDFWIASCLLIAEMILRPTLIAVALTILCISMVFCAELFNTAIERIVNELTGNKWMLWAKYVKDTSAGAVFMVAFGTFGIGIWAILTARPWRIELFSHRHMGGMILAVCGLTALLLLRFGTAIEFEKQKKSHENE